MSLPSDFASISMCLCFLSLGGSSGKGTSCGFLLGPNTNSQDIPAFTVSRGSPSRRQVPCKGMCVGYGISAWFVVRVSVLTVKGTVWFVRVVVASGALGVSGMCVGYGISAWFVVRVSVLTVKGTVWFVRVVVGSGALGMSGMCVGYGISEWFVVRVSVLTVKGIVDLVVE
nr:hypothetical protein CFP56_78267 [Quercus suber]